MAQGVSMSNFAEDNFDHSGLGFIGGGTVFLNHERHPIAAAEVQSFGRSPAWGSKWKSFVHQNSDRWISAYMQCNSLPYENTYLDLDPEAKDRLGDPVCRITAGPKDNEQKASNYAADRAAEWFREAGAVEVVRTRTGGAPEISTHAVGGTRMGENAEINVVNPWGFSHEAPNLGIVGGSVLPTHGARNPTLTIQALSWRTAEHLVKNWKTVSA
jgi:gluconate 2-dehydrogenase alpha chain